ncbi:MAG: Thiamine-monophosphate kinase [Acidobacteria bacterium]|nr:Thiamine-monophosphate kinase [Acidobacteriota bacterium]
MNAPPPSQPRTVSDLGERALIERITARLAMPSWVVVGPGDDAAVIEPERGTLDVLTTDAQVEGVHFDRRFVPPDAIGHRALAVNLSDLAAMGATPRAVLLSLVLPDALDVAVVDGVLDGLLALAAAHNVAVVGGNISRSPGPMMVDVTAVGAVRPRRLLTRAGARPGDGVYVTGTIGDAMVGLQSLQQGRLWCAACQERYLRPEPRVRAGMLLGRNRAASACMDTSDGLADAVRQVAEASQVGIAVDATALPIGDEVRRWHDAQGHGVVDSGVDRGVDAVIGGGDDYELLFTVRPRHLGRLRDVRRRLGGLSITKIGMVTKERRLSIRTEAGERPLPEGFDHFR